MAIEEEMGLGAIFLVKRCFLDQVLMIEYCALKEEENNILL